MTGRIRDRPLPLSEALYVADLTLAWCAGWIGDDEDHTIKRARKALDGWRAGLAGDDVATGIDGQKSDVKRGV